MGDNEDRSGCYLSFRAPLETRPAAPPSILVPLTLACDIRTHWPDIDPNAALCDKRANAEAPSLPGVDPGSRHCSKQRFAASPGMFANE